MIYNSGELSLIEYGESEILGSVLTEFVSPHLLRWENNHCVVLADIFTQNIALSAPLF